MSAGTDRLNRMLVMVPYFLAHPGVNAAKAAVDLGTTPKQVLEDLQQLWMCGLPGYTPGDLIDLAFSPDSVEDGVAVTFSAGIDRPLKLTGTEAAPLLVALRSLIDAAGVVDPAAARRAIAKIENAMGSRLGEAVTDTPVDLSSAGESDAVTAVREAVRSHRAVRLRYYSASRDVVGERVVDPIRIQAIQNHGYLEGWCRSSEGIRLFRFDRIEAATVLDEPSAPPPSAGDSALALFESDSELPEAVVEIDPDVVWVLDYYLIEPLDPDNLAGSQGPVVATMRYGSEEWLTRFVLSFGGKIRVRNSELSGEVRSRAAATLGMYGADSLPAT
ncbi:UNVERIFIED_CONTAM: proteasome accessory factor C [Williamsia faeni]